MYRSAQQGWEVIVGCDLFLLAKKHKRDKSCSVNDDWKARFFRKVETVVVVVVVTLVRSNCFQSFHASGHIHAPASLSAVHDHVHFHTEGPLVHWFIL